MAEQINESYFYKRVVEVAKELSAMTENATDGKHRGIIILAAEEVDESTSKNCCAICGRGKEVTSVLRDFATQPATADLFKRVALSVALNNIIKN